MNNYPDLTPSVSENDHRSGPESALITLVEYGDYECPYCGMAYPIVKAIRKKLHSQLQFVFRNFPLKESHPHAAHAAEIAEAAGAQGKFWEMHDMLYENQHALTDQDLLNYAAEVGLNVEQMEQALIDKIYVKRVRDDFRNGVKSGVNGTPTFFINGMRYDGIWSDEDAFYKAVARVSK